MNQRGHQDLWNSCEKNTDNDEANLSIFLLREEEIKWYQRSNTITLLTIFGGWLLAAENNEDFRQHLLFSVINQSRRK
jgi:hypothetical protein